MFFYLITGFLYTGAIGILYWCFHRRYLEFTGTVRTHVLNTALIVGVTAVVIVATPDLFTRILVHGPAGGVPARSAARVIGIYLAIPCGVFVARYGSVDMGGYERVRWPTTLAGWLTAIVATGLLLLGQLAM